MDENQKRGFWGVIIPIEILDNTELSISEKFVYCYIASYTKMCLDSNDRIAERLGVDARTVQRALKKLQEIGYVFVEFVENNTSKRRIYAIHDNPKKIAYLIKKGLFDGGGEASFPQTRQNVASDESTRQNVVETRQNVVSHNGGETRQNVTQRIKEEKEEGKTEQKPNDTTDRASLAGCGPARSGLGLTRPRRADFESDDDYAEACYNWQTISIGAN